MSARGPSQLCIFDIHTLQNQFYFSDNVLVRLLSCVDLLIRELRKPYMADEDIAIAFPDEGTYVCVCRHAWPCVA